jgi:hypothetical protein
MITGGAFTAVCSTPGRVLFQAGAVIRHYCTKGNGRSRFAVRAAETGEKAMIIWDRNLATHTYFTDQLKPALFDDQTVGR